MSPLDDNNSNLSCYEILETPPHSPKRKNSVDEVVQLQFFSPLKGLKYRKMNQNQQLLTQSNQQRQLFPEASPSTLVKEQISYIYDYLYRKPVSHADFQNIEMWIKIICDYVEWDEERKLAELGILFFYIVRDEGKVPFEDSYITTRKQEMERELEKLRESFDDNCPSSCQPFIASGATAYIYRALARLIIPPDYSSDRVFNLGGCFAIKALLNTSLCNWMSEEQRLQILSVVHTFIENAQMRKTFMTPFSIHLDAISLIWFDLKMPQGETIDFIHIQWALLISLFSLDGQLDEGNCFAIATATNLFRMHPEFLFNKVIELLERGEFVFEGITIPFFQMTQLLHVKDCELEYQLPFSSISNLIGVDIAKQSLGHGAVAAILQGTAISIGDWMDKAFGDDAESGKRYFSSFNQVFIRRLCCDIILFDAINSVQVPQFYSTKKQFFPNINSCLVNGLALTYPIMEKLKNNDSEIGDFLARCFQKLEQQVWFTDVRCEKMRVERGHVVFDNRSQGLIFEGNLANYRPFLDIRQAWIVHDGYLEKIEKLTQYREFFIRIIDKETRPTDTNEIIYFVTKLKEYVLTEAFLKDLSSVISQMNKVSLRPDIYYESDSFFLIQHGGYIDFLFGSPYSSLKLSKKTYHFKTIKDFYSKICQKIREYSLQRPDLFARPDTQILISTGYHLFNLLPLNFKNYWEGDSAANLDQFLFSRARDKLKKALPYETKKRILESFLDQSDVEKIFKIVQSNRIGLTTFRKEVRKLIPEHLYDNFDHAINIVFNQISYTSFLSQIDPILAHSGLVVDDVGTKFRIFSILQDFGKGRGMLLPAELALIMQKVLLEVEVPYVSQMRIEDAICDVYQLPRSIVFANLNWVERVTESMSYSLGVIKYNFATRELFFYLREKEKDKRCFIDDTFLKTVRLLIEES